MHDVALHDHCIIDYLGLHNYVGTVLVDIAKKCSTVCNGKNYCGHSVCGLSY